MAHEALRDILDQALSTLGGVKLDFSTKEAANSWRMAAYAARRHDIAQSRTIYPEDHASYETSPYDALVIRYASPTILTITLKEAPPNVTPLLAPGERPLYPQKGKS